MDRLERFFLNSAIVRFVLSLIIICILAMPVCFFAADLCAEKIIESQIEISLSAAGGNMTDAGFITSGINEEYISNSEQVFAKYGVDRDISPRLVHNFKETRKMLFTLLSSLVSVIILVILTIGVTNRMKTMKRIDEIRRECSEITDGIKKMVRITDKDSGSLKNLADSINKLAYMADNTAYMLSRERHFLKEFLTDFSHQLKTPCAVIRLNNELLDSIGSSNDEKSEMLISEINSQLDIIENMLNESLKIARLNANTVDYNFVNGNVTEICSDVVCRLSAIADNENVKLTLEESPDIFMKLDDVWLNEALCNIVKNSIEHSNADEVKISVSELPTSVSVIIGDNGDGIPQEKIPELFNRYNTKSRSTSVQSSVGIGMAISKKIVEAHNGEILVFSKIGEGTRFEIIFLKKI